MPPFKVPPPLKGAFMRPNLPLFGLLLLIFLFHSCSRTRPLLQHPEHSESIAELNYLGKTKESSLKFKSGKIVRAATIEVTNDSLKYKPLHSDTIQYVRLKEISSISFKDHYVSLFDGALFGFIGGLAGGYLYVDRDSDMAGLALAGSAAGGMVVGALVGGLIGSKIEYKIDFPQKTVQKNK